MISRMILLVLSIVSIGLSSAQLIQDLKCDPDINLQENFNLTAFRGKWNVVRRTELPGQPTGCSDLEIVEENNRIYLLERVINQNFPEELKSPATYHAGEARFSVNRSNSNEPADFRILLTDHSNYALAYTCKDVDSSRQVTIWELRRPLSTIVIVEAFINQTLSRLFGITRDNLVTVDRSETTCKILPEIPPGQNVILPGQCDPNMPVVQNFDVTAFTGRWFGISSYYSVNQAGGKCGRAQYTLSGGVVVVENSMVVAQQLEVIRGTASVSTMDGSARLLVTLEIMPGVFVDSPLWILATDYKEYAVSYTCVNRPDNQKQVNAWILSRTRELTNDSQIAIDEVISREVDLNKNYFMADDQSDESCFYYPEHDPKRPVVFRGQCERNNVTAMPNFNAVAYMGLWHNIESYPSISSSGTCNNAFYTLKDGFVDVFNTQVIDEKLLTIDGVARVASTDGSAKLTVDFPIAGTDSFSTADYWVLDTDYSNFALVYSCRNDGDEYQQVTSFKLSRTKVLPADAETRINRVMADVKVLDQRYFEKNDQSREGCFYFPEPQPGVPVRFPGQCDTNIQAISNFDMTRFQGIWHETEAYPKIQQTGQCVKHNYNSAGNTMNLITTSVLNQVQTVTNSQVTFNSSQDTSGRLTITLMSGGSEIRIPFWIIDTDYSSYALAYSCENDGDDYRRVFSWKLSRTPQLTTDATVYINRAMQNIDVLQDIYFEPIQQTDDFCFYLPEYVPGQPVTFDGKCDEQIAVVQNFDAAAYLGRWRRISSYPEPFQFGKCNQATYSLNADGSTVDVYNTQVVDGVLDSINGTAVLNSTDGSAKLAVNFPTTPEAAPYWVLDTDYETFALVYSCRNLENNQRRVAAWKLSRYTQLSENATQRINEVINRINVLNEIYFESDDQSDEACFYLPEPGPNAPIFRGQCETIPVVSNFNAGAYLGQWYDIASYSTEFQQGTCNSAYYSLGDGVVDVFNTQVINQRLDTMTGIAEVVSTDGSAKLDVTFPIVGTNNNITTPYWVLSTDYVSYSLVYTCVNIGLEHRQVWSWKLSRTTNLTDHAVEAINNATAKIPVLDEQYYVTRDHSPQGCFYYPEPEEGKPVVFRGQCDSTIQAVPNFNMTAFQGVWHEIEAYPKEQQSGHCINHEYETQQTGTEMNLVSSSIIDQIRRFTNSRVIFASTQDNSGKLNITLTSGGETITIPFWVLSVDYNDHALAYSCVNVNETYRAVYSWKLSRTQQLSTQGNATINDKISEIDVLNQNYYEKIGQSDRDCFYLPDPTPGVPMEFVGQCDENLPVVQNFDPVAYLGRWRRISSYPEPFQFGKCNQATYSLNADGSTVDVYNTQVVDGVLDSINGTAVLNSTDGSAKLAVNFPTTPEAAPYWVLDTDYETFALVYSCRNLENNRRRVAAWKLSRDTQLSENATQRINEVINRINVLNEMYFEYDDQSDEACFYLPPPGPNAPIFRGQCDETIPVVSNFNPGAYLGQWYDIASYSTEFQQGTCNSAYYSLGDGVVDVFNTQVINQRLDTMTGIAEVVSTDGSAKLDVTFPIVGTNNTITTPYWVLSTDYVSYSLVYTCVNIGLEHRQVWSWKLSRTTNLTDHAVEAINNATAKIPVLDEQYYVTRDHSPQGCFYYPEPEEGKPVVFRGQCDSTIQAVPNFNMTAFQGVWHEIEAYPKEQQSGQCINHEYETQQIGTEMNLVSSSIIDQIRRFTNSRVIFASTQDNSGKLNITLTSGGETITIPFWVLSVDYNDHALAYSCVNINETYRAVYSWKLSRTQQLSTQGNATINDKISEIDVLNQIYYEKIGQSDRDCFYLPDPTPGVPVEFVGQCDENLPVVQNFDPVAYGGRWRMIETYPSEFQTNGSTCLEATYTLTDAGTVDVYNTEVFDQQLLTINGTAALASTDGSAKLTVSFPGAAENATYWVLGTDYVSYALVYSCRNTGPNKRTVYTWKLSRTRELTQNATRQINQIVDQVDVLNEKLYEKITHSDAACFYYPIPDGNPVVFRGQCNQSIPVVTEFDAVAYMGTWYDIEGYPVQFQDGTCPTANYTLGANGVDVFNTQVVSQWLDTIRGSAVLTNNDGLAKLDVTFPVAGTNLTIVTPYWVLATNYSDFALVYTCVDINPEYHRVASWKLSRTKTLSPQSRAEIDRVVATIPVLKEDYYEVRGHTEEDCFFYPDNEGGPVIQDGQCESAGINVVDRFSITAFSGRWYEISRFPSETQEGGCVSEDFVIVNRSISVHQTYVLNERQRKDSGPVTLSPDGRGIFTVNITDPVGGGITQATFQVLAVDYDDFALLYSCRNMGNTRRQIFSWKWSRSQSGLSPAAATKIDQIVRDSKPLFERYYETTDQTINGCFNYPRFDELPPTIELLGPCDTRIRAKANFDVAAYLGKWYEIASYPQPFQFGQCARAQYNLGDGAVDVINTQVVNKTLDVQLATAVVASDDGSGLLSVTFNLTGEVVVVNVVDYYVLESDYTNFSLVYSCSNTSDGNRRVTSWILSRQTTLSEEAMPIIESIINSTQGLDPDYYQLTGQTEDDCFYIPEVNKNEAPRFRGQCGNITGVQGFNIQRYLGWWHEIESYPTDNDRGTCISSEYAQLSNEYLVTDTNIFNNTAQVNTSVVTATTDGRIRKISMNGEVTDTWVLATDYETYSLLYSCENIDSQYMRVWSAKHSKSRRLTQAAQDAMSEYIAATRTLETQFFKVVDQSDSSCFHLPEEITGGQVILSGQCDLNIPVVQNFSVSQYGGTWYQIERYPQIHENGTCIGARYTLNENTGVVAVLNWQVVNGTLDQVEGTATLNSTDGSAKLIVTLPIRFTEEAEPKMVSMELYVLTTDYVTYSLAYSCVNVGAKRRAVGAWKLSRTRSLTNESIAVIDAYMATREELHQPYFIQVEQKDDCLEPSSAMLVKSSIIIMLICSILHYVL